MLRPFEPKLHASPGMRLRIDSETAPLTATAGWRMVLGTRRSPALEDWAPFQIPYGPGEAPAVFSHPAAPGFELQLTFTVSPNGAWCFLSLSELVGALPSTLFGVLFKQVWTNWPDSRKRPGNSRLIDRFRLIQPHLEQNQSLQSVADAAGVPYRTAQRWVAQYRLFGLAALARKRREDRGERRVVSAKLKQVIEGVALQKPPLPLAALFPEGAAVVQGLG